MIKALKAAAGWWALLTILFFLTFPLWAGTLIDVLRFVLEGLNSFGAGH